MIIKLADESGMREKLLEVGCRQYQGWYYSPAIPLEEFVKLMDDK